MKTEKLQVELFFITDMKIGNEIRATNQKDKKEYKKYDIAIVSSGLF